MTTSPLRRASASASLLRHPLRLWPRHTLPGSLRRDALLRLADLAAHRAVDAEISGTASSTGNPSDGVRQAERWRRVSSGILVGDATALLALSRGILVDRRDGRLEDGVDASLCALRLAMHGGSRSERIVAAAELLLALPDLIGQRDAPHPRLIDGILAGLAADHRLTDVRMLPTIPAMLLNELRAAYVRQRDPRRLRTGLQGALAMSAQIEEGACPDLAPVLH